MRTAGGSTHDKDASGVITVFYVIVVFTPMGIKVSGAVVFAGRVSVAAAVGAGVFAGRVSVALAVGAGCSTDCRVVGVLFSGRRFALSADGPVGATAAAVSAKIDGKGAGLAGEACCGWETTDVGADVVGVETVGAVKRISI